jgi:potassium channel subfamily K, other eukaryote
MEVPTWIPDHNCQGRRAVGGVGDRIAKLRRAAEWAGFTERKIGHSHILHGPTGMRLNLSALTHMQLEASALEAGVPLDVLLPSDLIPSAEETSGHNTDADIGTNASAPLDWMHGSLDSRFERVFHPTAAHTLTQARLGGMLTLLTHFAVAAVHRHAPTADVLDQHRPTNQGANPASSNVLSGETSNNLQTDPPIIKVDKSASHLDFSSMVAHSSDNLDLVEWAIASHGMYESHLLVIFFICIISMNMK